MKNRRCGDYREQLPLLAKWALAANAADELAKLLLHNALPCVFDKTTPKTDSTVKIGAVCCSPVFWSAKPVARTLASGYRPLVRDGPQPILGLIGVGVCRQAWRSADYGHRYHPPPDLLKNKTDGVDVWQYGDPPAVFSADRRLLKAIKRRCGCRCENCRRR